MDSYSNALIQGRTALNEFDSLFRDEMDRLRQWGKRIAQENPTLAPFLGEAAADPNVERLKTGFALLAARLRGKIDDAFPEITQSLLERVWPFPLQSIPSTTLIQFSATRNKRHINESLTIAKGAKVYGLNKGKKITFITAQPLSIEPLKIIKRTLLRRNDSTDIELLFKYYGKGDLWKTRTLSLYCGNNEKNAALLRYYLNCHLSKTCFTCNDEWTTLDLSSPLSETPARNHLVLPDSTPVFWPLQLLAEYYYLKHTQDFITLDFGKFLPSIKLAADNTFTLRFRLDAPLPLHSIDDCFLLNCVPAVNLEEKTSAAIAFAQGRSRYEIPLAENEGIYRIHGLAHRYNATKADEREQEDLYYPVAQFHQHQHPFSSEEAPLCYYQHCPEDNLIGETKNVLRFYNRQLEPLTDRNGQAFICRYTGFAWQVDPACQIDTISADVAPGLKVRNITPFTPVLPAVYASQTHWHAVINHLSMSSVLLGHKEKIVQVLEDLGFHARYDATLRASIARRIDSIVAVEAAPADCLIRGVVVRGQQMHLTLDPAAFEHVSEMYQFANVLNTLFTFCLSESSFYQLNVINARTSETWTFAWVSGQRPIM